MSALDTLDIYLVGLEPTVRIRLLGSQHVGTLERALEESRIFANAHRGHGVRNSGRVDPFKDPVYLTFQAPCGKTCRICAPSYAVTFNLGAMFQLWTDWTSAFCLSAA